MPIAVVSSLPKRSAHSDGTKERVEDQNASWVNVERSVIHAADKARMDRSRRLSV
jgi:hypothetical protein